MNFWDWKNRELNDSDVPEIFVRILLTSGYRKHLYFAVIEFSAERISENQYRTLPSTEPMLQWTSFFSPKLIWANLNHRVILIQYFRAKFDKIFSSLHLHPIHLPKPHIFDVNHLGPKWFLLYVFQQLCLLFNSHSVQPPSLFLNS